MGVVAFIVGGIAFTWLMIYAPTVRNAALAFFALCAAAGLIIWAVAMAQH